MQYLVWMDAWLECKTSYMSSSLYTSVKSVIFPNDFGEKLQEKPDCHLWFNKMPNRCWKSRVAPWFNETATKKGQCSKASWKSPKSHRAGFAVMQCALKSHVDPGVGINHLEELLNDSNRRVYPNRYKILLKYYFIFGKLWGENFCFSLKLFCFFILCVM